ncbi:MAG TPA: hypothetical protein VM940_09060 [Chthoniobacterales bacterium]|jgi:hypothetical protein|nr:hypothetical protein [Chthoniobacterales bacterium]
MKRLAMLLCVISAFSLLAQTGTLEVGADPKLHGAAPTNYQEIITNWLQTVLVDPASAQIEWISGPKPGTMPEKKGGDPLFGYLVEFKLNSRNRFGAYTGMQKKTVLIHGGQVVKTKGFRFGF